MDCQWDRSVFTYLMLAIALLTVASSRAEAAPQEGLVYNPVTQQMEPRVRNRRMASWTSEDVQAKVKKPTPGQVDNPPRAKNALPDFEIEQAAYEEEGYYDESGYCDDSCVGCGDMACGNCVGEGYWADGIYAGFEATIVKPRFANNPAYTVMTSDGALFENFTEVDFNYDTEFTPRVFVGWQNCDGFGMKVTWWQFDHAAGSLSDNPPANGFGEIAPPPFGNIDISTNVPTDVFTAGSGLNVYAIDLEATRQAMLGRWKIAVGGGLRYAFAEQQYSAQVRDSGNALLSQIDFRQSIEGVGPTISLEAYRILTPTVSTFCKGRGSVLFGDGESRLLAGEDLDLANSFITRSVTSRDDLLSIAEIQYGVRWEGIRTRHRIFVPFLSIALEGQVWNGAGSATSEEGNIGFFGFNTGFGIGW